MVRKVVLAYSGGLDTSVSIPWLQEKYDAEVVTMTLDMGQNEDMEEIKERAYSIGSVRHYSINALGDFVSNYVSRAIKANGLYQGKYPLSTALGRPLIARKLVEIAEKENADAVAHGCTGKGNDQVRIEVTVKALDSNLRIIAPVREWNMTRDEEIKYAMERRLPIKSSRSIYSIDQNIWGRSIESGTLEEPDQEPPEDIFEWVKSAEDAPDKPAYVEIYFEGGLPSMINGEELGEIELIKTMNKIAGENGFGIIDHIEDRLVGIKSREVYECPAAISIIEAHKDLEKLTLTKHELEFKAYAEQVWSWLVYSGLWEEPLRKELDCFFEETQKKVTGTVKMKFYKGSMRIVGRKSENQIYNTSLSSYGSESKFNQRLAEGFIELWGLQSVLASRVKRGNGLEGDTSNWQETKEAKRRSN